MQLLDRVVLVDVEGGQWAPGLPGAVLHKYGAVHYSSGATFYYVAGAPGSTTQGFAEFQAWLQQHVPGARPVMVTDNPAYDWQWINYGFQLHCGANPFGHSARRIGDYYAGLINDWQDTQGWKRLRVTKHDHDPVHDAQGNAEALRALLAGRLRPSTEE
jgi:hypothetical protein